MSSPKSDSGRPVAGLKPRSNVYTVMLFISLIAVITACILLFLELERFGNFPYWKTSRIERTLVPSAMSDTKWL